MKYREYPLPKDEHIVSLVAFDKHLYMATNKHMFELVKTVTGPDAFRPVLIVEPDE